jgi:hypothetical protein
MHARKRSSISSYLTVLLSIVWYAVAGVLVVTGLVLVYAFFADVPGLEIIPIPPSFGVNAPTHSNWTMTIPVSLSADPATSTAVAPSLGIERAELRDLRGSLRFPARGGLFFAANLVLLMLAMFLMLWVTSQLRAVLRTVRDGRPFVPVNATRVRRIGWAVIAGELARTAVVLLENAYAMQHFSAEGLTFSVRPDLSVFAIIQGLIILVIAEVFRAGTRLDEEQSLTV